MIFQFAADCMGCSCCCWLDCWHLALINIKCRHHYTMPTSVISHSHHFLACPHLCLLQPCGWPSPQQLPPPPVHRSLSFQVGEFFLFLPIVAYHVSVWHPLCVNHMMMDVACVAAWCLHVARQRMNPHGIVSTPASSQCPYFYWLVVAKYRHHLMISLPPATAAS